VPVNLDILEKLKIHFVYEEIDYYGDLKNKLKQRQHYFFLENNLGKRFVFDLPEAVPSQYIRKIIACQVGKRERWNWREYLGLEELNTTLEKLRGKL